MRVIAAIEDSIVIKKILKHLGLWVVKRKPRPVANCPPDDLFPAYLPVRGTQTGDEQPGPCVDDYLTDPDHPAEAYF